MTANSGLSESTRWWLQIRHTVWQSLYLSGGATAPEFPELSRGSTLRLLPARPLADCRAPSFHDLLHYRRVSRETNGMAGCTPGCRTYGIRSCRPVSAHWLPPKTSGEVVSGGRQLQTFSRIRAVFLRLATPNRLQVPQGGKGCRNQGAVESSSDSGLCFAYFWWKPLFALLWRLMVRAGVRAPTRPCSLLLFITIAACSPRPIVISADTSCERFRRIYADDDQRAAIKADWGLWETFARQVADNNDAYDAACTAVQP